MLTAGSTHQIQPGAQIIQQGSLFKRKQLSRSLRHRLASLKASAQKNMRRSLLKRQMLGHRPRQQPVADLAALQNGVVGWVGVRVRACQHSGQFA